MTTLTVDSVMDALLANAGYEANNSLSEAQAFVTACRRFFILVPQMSMDQGSSLRMSVEQVERQMQAAQMFITQKQAASNGEVRYFSLENCR